MSSAPKPRAIEKILKELFYGETSDSNPGFAEFIGFLYFSWRWHARRYIFVNANTGGSHDVMQLVELMDVLLMDNI